MGVNKLLIFLLTLTTALRLIGADGGLNDNPFPDNEASYDERYFIAPQPQGSKAEAPQPEESEPEESEPEESEPEESDPEEPQPNEYFRALEPLMKYGGYATFLTSKPLPISGIPLRGGFLIRLPPHTLSVSLTFLVEDQAQVEGTTPLPSDVVELYPPVVRGAPSLLETISDDPEIKIEDPAHKLQDYISPFEAAEWPTETADVSDTVKSFPVGALPPWGAEVSNKFMSGAGTDDLSFSLMKFPPAYTEKEDESGEEEDENYFWRLDWHLYLWASLILFLSGRSSLAILGAFLRSRRGSKGNVMVVNIPEYNVPLLQAREEGYAKRETNGNEFDDSAAVPYARPAVPKN